MISTEKRWLTPDDVSKIFEISVNQQAKMRMKTSKFKIPFSKIGNYIRYDKYDLDKWFEEHKIVELR